jgi:hypothetical protein
LEANAFASTFESPTIALTRLLWFLATSSSLLLKY